MRGVAPHDSDEPFRLGRQRRLGDNSRLVEIAYAPKWGFPAHEHAQSCVSLVLSGSFRDRYRGRWREVSAGSVVSYRAGSSHRGLIASTGAEVFQLEIEVDELSDESPPRRWSEDRRAMGVALAPGLAHELHFEFVSGRLDDELVLSSLAHELAAEVYGIPRPHRGQSPGWLNRVLELLRENVSRTLTLDELAREAEFHRCHLAREFRRRIGMSVGDYRRRLRVALSAEKLSHTKLSIADIALDMGYADQSHMGREFKRLMGMTPARYRGGVPG